MSLFITKSAGIFTPNYLIIRTVYNRCRIGNRDWVGFGHNGSANYKDDAHFPFPAVRFKENTRDIWALREKERGDWKCLCCEEKKALYRSSFCQTFSEFQHSTGLWKVVLGGVLFGTSFTFWAMMFHHYYVFEPLPASLAKEAQKAQLRRILELRMNPIDGISSLWDYDNDRWKPGCEPCRLKEARPVERDDPPHKYCEQDPASTQPQYLFNMKCAVAIVLALIGMVVANPVAPLGYGYGYGYGSPLLLPSAVSVSSSFVNHGLSIPKIVAPVISTPVISAPIIRTVPVLKAPVVSSYGWGGYGLGGLGWGGYGLGGLGWGGYGLGWGGKGWH